MIDIKKYFIDHRYLLPIAVFIGFLLRIIYLSSPDFYYDEASLAMGQKALIEKSISPWITINWQPPLYSYVVSISTRLLGVNEFSIRLTSAIFGTLSIVLVYFLGKLWFGRKTGLLAAILLAVSPLHVIHSRTAFSDVFHTFFVILTILSMEFLILKKISRVNISAFILLSGALSAVALFIKYNTLIPLGIYWLFVLGRDLMQHNRDIFKKHFIYMLLINFIAIIASMIIILATGGISRLILLIHNIFLDAFLQFEQYTNPYYYTFLVLFVGLFPLIALLVPCAIAFLATHKKRNRNDYLVVFFVLLYIIIFIVQVRRYSRHLMIVFPIIMILVSRFLLLIYDKLAELKMPINLKVGGFFIIFLIILSSSALSIYEVKKINGFHVWKELQEYIKKNYQDATAVHGSNHKNRQIRYYIQEDADNSELITTIKKGDLVIFTWLYKNSTIMENSPFEDNVMFYSKKRYEFSPEFISYVLKHGQLVKTFEYKGGTAAWIYEIKSLDKNVRDPIKEDIFSNFSLFGVWNIVCKGWNYISFRSIIEKFATTEQTNSIQLKCISSNS